MMCSPSAEMAALLREAENVARSCGAEDVRRACAEEAAQIESYLNDTEEQLSRRLIEQRALVGKYFKDRYFSLDSPRDPKTRPTLYRAVVGCDEHAQLRCWSFVRTLSGAVVVDVNDRSAIFGSSGEEITREEFYEAAGSMLETIVPLLSGAVDD